MGYRNERKNTTHPAEPTIRVTFSPGVSLSIVAEQNAIALILGKGMPQFVARSTPVCWWRSMVEPMFSGGLI